MSTILYLVRHGETDWNKTNLFQGRTDIPLSEEGIWQAKQTKERLKGKFDVVYTSPLSRAVQTAKIISENTELSPIIYENLIEIDFGKWEGLPYDEIKDIFPKEHKLWKTDNNTAPLVGGEQNMKNASIRGKNAFLDIVNKNQNKRILLVAHGGLIKAGIVGLYNFGINMYHNMYIDNTSITTIKFFEDRKPLTLGLNDTCHLHSF